MVKALFDTNVLIDYLNGVKDARVELARFEDKAISIVTWMEVMVGTTPANEAGTRAFLAGFAHLPIDEQVAERAVALRRDKRIKLPDAIVWATAQTSDRLLVTRNTKDFAADEPGVRVPY
jgi:predicted nucleic acid-binding protein